MCYLIVYDGGNGLIAILSEYYNIRIFSGALRVFGVAIAGSLLIYLNG